MRDIFAGAFQGQIGRAVGDVIEVLGRIAGVAAAEERPVAEHVPGDRGHDRPQLDRFGRLVGRQGLVALELDETVPLGDDQQPGRRQAAGQQRQPPSPGQGEPDRQCHGEGAAHPDAAGQCRGDGRQHGNGRGDQQQAEKRRGKGRGQRAAAGRAGCCPSTFPAHLGFLPATATTAARYPGRWPAGCRCRSGAAAVPRPADELAGALQGGGGDVRREHQPPRLKVLAQRDHRQIHPEHRKAAPQGKGRPLGPFRLPGNPVHGAGHQVADHQRPNWPGVARLRNRDQCAYQQQCQQQQQADVGLAQRLGIGQSPAPPEEVLHDQQGQQHAVGRQRQRTQLNFIKVQTKTGAGQQHQQAAAQQPAAQKHHRPPGHDHDGGDNGQRFHRQV